MSGGGGDVPCSVSTEKLLPGEQKEEDEKEKTPHSTTTTSPPNPPKDLTPQQIKLAKFSDPKLDPTWLHSELRKEICRESTYNLENDAKLRACSQGTVNYEQFRQMVLGAHLRPLDRKDKVEGCQNGRRPPVVWNTAAVKKNEDLAGRDGSSPSEDDKGKDLAEASAGIFSGGRGGDEDGVSGGNGAK